jgi:hypothetical protein
MLPPVVAVVVVAVVVVAVVVVAVVVVVSFFTPGAHMQQLRVVFSYVMAARLLFA